MKPAILLLTLLIVACVNKSDLTLNRYEKTAVVTFTDGSKDTVSTVVYCRTVPKLGLSSARSSSCYLFIWKDNGDYDIIASGVRSFKEITNK